MLRLVKCTVPPIKHLIVLNNSILLLYLFIHCCQHSQPDGDRTLRFCLISFQLEDSNQSDSDEEPSPEALARYLAMRRHTVGVGDPRHEVTDDLRVKLPPYYPLMPQQLVAPLPPPPDVNLPEVSLTWPPHNF